MTVLGIIGIIIAVFLLTIAILLALPLNFILYNDSSSGLQFRVRFLWIIFGDSSKPKSGMSEKIKKALNLEKISHPEKLKKDILSTEFVSIVSEITTVLKALLVRFVRLLKHCKINKFRLICIAAGNDAGNAAIEYGLACSVLYPFIGWLKSNIKFGKNAEKITIKCDFEEEKPVFDFDIVISVRIIYIVGALIGVINSKIRSQIKKETENEQ